MSPLEPRGRAGIPGASTYSMLRYMIDGVSMSSNATASLPSHLKHMKDRSIHITDLHQLGTVDCRGCGDVMDLSLTKWPVCVSINQ